MIFDRIKNLFSAGPGAEKPSSPDRAELAAIIHQISDARAASKAIEERAANLRTIIEAGAAAEHELHVLVASPSGASGLADFSVGRKGTVSRGVGKASRAAQSAEVARRALPIVEGELAAANASIERLEMSKKNKVGQILTKEHGDRLAQKYLQKFREFYEIHDHMVGFARGCNNIGIGNNVVMSSETIEVPRFNLPALACTGPYSPFLTHAPDQQTVSAAALAWSRFGRRLATDPHAHVGADLSPDLAGEVGRHPEHRSDDLVWLPRRERHEPDLKEVLYGGEDRTRTIHWRLRLPQESPAGGDIK
jgi:hypothetical protein